MFQFHMSINKSYIEWFNSIEKVLSIKLKSHSAIMASKLNGSRLDISIACETNHKTDVVQIIKSSISDMYLTVCKFNYLNEKLFLPYLKDDSKNILLHTLVAFDRECEASIIEENLVLDNSFALDGFFNFRLKDLKKRWDEIVDLAKNNAMHLSNEETLNELIRFLMSAVAPKIQKLDLSFSQGEFCIKGNYENSNFEYKIVNKEQLLYYLINVAPIEINIYGKNFDSSVYNKIVNIFDVKNITM